MMIATGISVILWLGFYLWYFLAFNHLVALRNTVAQTWAHVDVELQRRYDLIGNLVNVVRAYARHEGDTLLETARARRGSGGINVHDANLATAQDSALLGKLLVLVERYPDLKADSQFQTLQQALIETENRIATRRNAYNECVNRYETGRNQFPAMVIAWAGHFGAAEFFDAQDETAHAVQVMLS
ncbi:MAG: LemA family protein [Gammaproteobacteria bacterium]